MFTLHRRTDLTNRIVTNHVAFSLMDGTVKGYVDDPNPESEYEQEYEFFRKVVAQANRYQKKAPNESPQRLLYAAKQACQLRNRDYTPLTFIERVVENARTMYELEGTARDILEYHRDLVIEDVRKVLEDARKA